MKRKIHHTILAIAIAALAMATVGIAQLGAQASRLDHQNSEEASITLEHKLEEGDQLTQKMSMGMKYAGAGMPGEMNLKAEGSLTQIVHQVSEDGLLDLLGIIHIEITQAMVGDRDMRADMGEESEHFHVVRQKMRKDGSIFEVTGMPELEDSPLGFQKPFSSLSMLPDKPVTVGSSWTRTIQEEMGDLSATYTLVGFEPLKGYECAKIKGEITGALHVDESVDAILEEGESLVHFAVKEGLGVRQKTTIKMQLTAPTGQQLTFDLSLQVELEDEKHVAPEELREMISSVELLETGLTQLHNRQYTEAKAEFQKFLSTYKESPWHSDVEELVARATEALSRKPPTVSPTSPHSQLRAYAREGQLDKLLEEAEKAMEADPSGRDTMVSYILIQGYQQHNRLDELVEHYQKKLQKQPTDVDIYKMLGQIYRRQRGQQEKAIEMYEKAAILAPNDVDALTSLGQIYKLQGMYQKAVATCRKAIELQPGRAYLYRTIAEAYVGMGRDEEAFKLVDEYRQRVQSGSLPSNEANMGDIYMAVKQYDEAIEAYKKAIELEPRNERYVGQRLLRCYEKAGKTEEAAELREALRSPSGTRLPIRKKASEFSLQTPDGRTVRLSDFKAKTVILNFWATWAPACMKEMTALEELYKAHKEALVVIGISMDTDSADAVRGYLEKMNITYPIVMATQEMLDEYNLVTEEPIETIPTTIIVDKRGTIRSEHAGPQDKNSLELAYKKVAESKQSVIEPIVRPTIATKQRTPMVQAVPRPTQANLVGRPAPSFAVRDLDGKEVRLADLKGKVVILDFWATWCPPCVKEIPHFIELYRQYKEQDFVMVGISTDRAGIEAVKSFVQQHQVNYPILMADGKVQQAYGGIRSIPTTFITDKEGRIQRQYVGYRDRSVFEADIKALLAGEYLAPSQPGQIGPAMPDVEELALNAARQGRQYVLEGDYEKGTGLLLKAVITDNTASRVREPFSEKGPSVVLNIVAEMVRGEIPEETVIDLSEELEEHEETPMAAFASHMVLATHYEAHSQPGKAGTEWEKSGIVKEDKWLVAGSFPYTRGDINAVFPPEEEKEIRLSSIYPGKYGEVRWREAGDTIADGVLDLRDAVASEDFVTAYAFTWIMCENQTEAQLRFGSDDQAKVWLNGTLQLIVAKPRSFCADADVVPVALNKGKNIILVKVCNERGHWGFSLRVVSSDGKALEGVRFVRPPEGVAKLEKLEPEADPSGWSAPGTPPPDADNLQQLILKIGDPEPGVTYGTMVLNDQPVSMETLLDRFQTATPKQKEMLIIQTGRSVPHNQIVRVMDLAERADIKKTDFAAANREPHKRVGTRELLREGRRLPDEEAGKLEQRLEADPGNLSIRTQLLGYYSRMRFQLDSARKARQQHTLWIIQHHPDAEVAGLPEAQLDPSLDDEVYYKAKQLWLEQVETHRKNTATLGNAGNFFLIHDRDISEDLFKKAQVLEPDNPKWSERLGHLYALGLSRKTGELKREAAVEALEQLENALSLTVGKRKRFYRLSKLAEVAFEAENMEKARSYATELLDLASQYKTDWNYGNAIHHGNLTLGRIALKSGKVEEAKSLLLKAGMTPGSPQLNSFGPSMTLAEELLQEGERETAIQYLKLCRNFWKKDILDGWIQIIEAGGIPEFRVKFRVKEKIASIQPPKTSRPSQTDLLGKPAPDSALRDLDGKEVKLSHFKGKVLILDFWATWCPPCVKEIPHFIDLYRQYKEQGLAMVGISTDRVGIEVVKSFVQKHHINYPILMADGKVQQAYGGTRAIPTTFVIDKAGRIQRKYVGYRDKAVFEADIKALLAGKSLAPMEPVPPSPTARPTMGSELEERVAGFDRTVAKELLSDLREVGKSRIADILEQRIEKKIEYVSRRGIGHIIIGRVVVDGPIDPRDVNAQMEILEEGYFAGPVKDLYRPVGFRLHGYAPFDLELKGKQGPIVNVGTIHMSHLPVNELASLKGKVILDGNTDSTMTDIHLSIMKGPVNTPSGGTEPRPGWPAPIKAVISPSGEFSADGFSPAEYYVSISARGHVKQARRQTFEQGKTLDMGTIRLEVPKKLKLTYYVSEALPFDQTEEKHETIDAGSRWKSVDSIYGWDLEFKQKNGVVSLYYNYAPCKIADLGTGNITDFMDVDPARLRFISPRGLQPKQGHVYLLDQRHWKHWVLLTLEIEK